jgi:hypothetical protein
MWQTYSIFLLTNTLRMAYKCLSSCLKSHDIMKVFSTSPPSVKMENVWNSTFKPPTFLHFVVTELRQNFSSYITFSTLFCQLVD